jgi:hypothetical protein
MVRDKSAILIIASTTCDNFSVILLQQKELSGKLHKSITIEKRSFTVHNKHVLWSRDKTRIALALFIVVRLVKGFIKQSCLVNFKHCVSMFWACRRFVDLHSGFIYVLVDIRSFYAL